MEFLGRFKAFLSSPARASKTTAKNYSSDVSHFIKWFEVKYEEKFDPNAVSAEVLKQFEADFSSKLARGSVERHLSSLRKFFHFLKIEGLASHDPFEQIKTSASKALAKADPLRLKDFKNNLYVFNASRLTIKNYIIDVKQFFTWLKEAIDSAQEASSPEYIVKKEANLLEYLDSKIIEEYKNFLLQEGKLSPASINRKLSSLRKYVHWASEEGLLHPEIRNSKFEIRNENLKKVVSADEIRSQLTNQQHAFIENSKLKIKNSRAYSGFPPIRLLQKIKHGTLSGLDGLIILPFAYLFDKAEDLVWTLKGKPIFEKQGQKIRKNRFSLQFSSALGDKSLKSVSNISKKVYLPHLVSTSGMPLHRKILFHARYTRPQWYKRYHTYPITNYVHLAILMIFMAALGYLFYDSFIGSAKDQKPTLASTSPPRILSFQGRLTDASDNPITSTTSFRFAIYNSLTASGSALLWQETKSISPDSDGIFATLLGEGTAIPQHLFADNSSLWLGVTVGATPELTPRQRLATVAYATNSELLQGMAPITNSGSTANVVLALNSSGNLVIGGSATPTFQATGGQFTLSGSTLLLTTNSGTNSNVIVKPDGIGMIDLQKPIQNTTNNNNISTAVGAVEVNDLFAILATSSGQSAFTLNQTSSGPLISASASGSERFTVANSGAITSAAYTNAGGIIYTQTSGTLAQTTIGTSTQCLLGGTTPSFGSCNASGTDVFWGQSSGALFPNNSTVDLLVGGQATTSAKFAVLNVNNGTPTASISANSGNNATFLTGSGNLATVNMQTLTIGGSTTGNITIDSGSSVITLSDPTTASSTLTTTGTLTANGALDANGQIDLGDGGDSFSLDSTALDVSTAGVISGATGLTSSGTITFSAFSANGGVLYTNGSGVLAQTAAGTSSDCLIGGTSPSFSSCAGAAAGAIFWNQSDGALFAKNSTVDLLVGGQATTSAKFAVLNVNSGTPTASLSAGSAGGAYLTAAGTLQTTANQSLTIGGATTGNITLAPLNGATGSNLTITSLTTTLNTTTTLTASSLTTFTGGATAIDFTEFDVSGSTGSITINDGGNAGQIDIESTVLDIDSLTFVGTGSIFSTGDTTIDATTDINLDADGADVILKDGGTEFARFTNSSTDLTITTAGGNILSASALNFGGAAAANYNYFASDISGNSTPDGVADLYVQDELEVDGTVRFNNLTYTFPSSETAGYVLQTNGTGTLSWVDTAVSGGYFTTSNGVAYPKGPYTAVNDLLLGSTATASAKFAFINVAAGTPTASISANSGNIATYLTGDGTLATTNRQTLTIGNSSTYNTTGNVLINPNGTGNVGIGTTTPTTGILTISQAADLGQIRLLNSTAGGTGLQITYDTATNANIFNTTANGSMSLTAQAGSSGGLQLSAAGGTSAQLYIPAANLRVGLHTTSPLASLDVRTSAGANSGTIAIASVSGATSFASLVVDNSGVGDIFTASSSGLNRFVIEQSGDVGIGTTTPSTLLHGDYSVDGAGVSNVFSIERSDPNTPATNFGVGLSFLLDRDDISASATESGRIETIMTDIANAATAMTFLTKASGGSLTETLRIASDGDLTLTGGDTITASSLATITSAATLGISATTLNLGGGAAATIGTVSDDNLSLSPNGTGDIRLVNDADTDIITPNFTAKNSSLYATETTGVLATATTTTSGLCLVSGASAPAWSSCSAAASNWWDQQNGTLYPINSTVDLLIGGQATTSAKFAVLNVNSGTPTASLSAGSAGGAYLTAAGTLQTTANQSLTIGGATTGNITLAPLNGATGSNLTITSLTTTLNTTTTLTASSLTTFTGGATAIDFSEFDVAAATGSITINDGGNAGQIDIESTVLDIDSLTFVGAGSIFTTGDTTIDATTDINLDADGGDILLKDAGTEFARFTNSTTDLTITTAGGNILSASALNFGGAAAAAYNYFASDISGVSTPDGVADLYVQDELEVDGTVRLNNITYTFPSTETANYILQTNGSGTLSWVDSAVSGGYFTTSNGVGYPRGPYTAVNDLLLGSTATASAKFGFLNVAAGTPTASISAGSAGGVYLNATGTLSTTAMQTLTLGGATTGNITIDAGSGTITLSDNTSLGGNLTFSGTGNITLAGGVISDGTDEVDISDDLAVSGVIQGGGTTATTYNRLGTGTAGGANIGANNDLLVSGALEVDDVLYLDGTLDTTFTAGSVVFAGTNGVLAQDNTNFFFDDTNNRLGIGINSSLLGTLDVRSTLGTIPVASLSGATSFASLVVDNSGVGDIFTASSSGLNRFVVKQSGNVGIGTTTPSSLLYVQSSATGTYSTTAAPTDTLSLQKVNSAAANNEYSSLRLAVTSNGAAGINATGFLTLVQPTTSNAASDFAFTLRNGSNNFNEGLRLKSTGLLGLNISAPAAVLDVRGVGTQTLSGTIPVASISGQTSFASLVVDNSGLGDIFTASSSGLTRFTIRQSGELVLGTIASPVFSVNSTGTTITASALATITSAATLGISATTLNLGGGSAATIGTVSDDNLSLSPNGTGDLLLVNDADTDAVLSAFITDANAVLYTTTTGVITRVAETETGSQCLVSGAGASGAPSWGSCGGSSNWRFNAGTLSPINDTVDVLIGANATASAKFGFLNVNSGTPTASISANSGANATTLTGTGILGTTNMQTLQLGNSTTGNINFYSSSNTLTSTGALTLALTATATQFIDANNSSYLLDPAATSDSLLTAGGIGIGTTSRLGTLDVRSISGTLPVATVSGATSFASLVVDNSGVGDIFTASSSGLNRFVVKQSGNVGIGTTVPSEKLHVSGGNILIDSQTNTTAANMQAWTRITQSTAGTIASGGTIDIASVSASVVYNGSLYVGTFEPNSAEVYRYDGTSGTNWTKVSQSTAGTIAEDVGATTGIDKVSSMIVYNGYMYIGTTESNSAEIYRYDGSSNWTELNATAGTFATTTAIDGVPSMAVFRGKLMAGTQEGGKAELYKYEGGTTWNVLNGTAGTFDTNITVQDKVSSMAVFDQLLILGLSKPAGAQLAYWKGNDATNVAIPISSTTAGSFRINNSGVTNFDDVPALAVFNNSLIVGLRKANNAEIVSWVGSQSFASSNDFARMGDSAGTIKTGGTANIDFIGSLAVYNGRLYAGTAEPNSAQIYRYDGFPASWTLVSQDTAGVIGAGETGSIDSIATLQNVQDQYLFAGTWKGGSNAQGYQYSGGIIDQSYALKFHGAGTNIAEQNSLSNIGSLFFVATTSANSNATSGNTGTFVMSHSLSFEAGSYDIAEDYPTRDETLEAGDLVSIDENERTFVRKSNGLVDKNMIGVHSSDPGLRLSQVGKILDGGRAIPVALAGRVPVKVSGEGGAIKPGDAITASTLPGVAMKANSAGQIVGRAMAYFSPQDETETGQVMIFINNTYYDPNPPILTTIEGIKNFTIVRLASQGVALRSYAYQVGDAAGGIVDQAQVLASAVIGNLSAGLIQTTDLIASNIITTDLKTDFISPIDDKLVIRFNSNDPGSSLEIQNSSGSAVASIDAEGNASLSGRLTANGLQTTEATVSGRLSADSASISGTLRASRIVADRIDGLDDLVARIASRSTDQTRDRDNTDYQAPDEGSSSAELADLGFESEFDIATLSAQLAYFNDINGATATFTQGLMSFGPSSLYDLSVASQLSVGAQLILADNSINVLGSSLMIQPLKQGGVDFLAGAVKIDVDGNLEVNGNATFAKDVNIKGTLSANLISPLPDQDLAIKLNQTSDLAVKNASESSVFTVNSSGDLYASGSATFGKLNLSIIPEALALSDTEVIATGSAGIAKINPYQSEVTIRNTLVTENSLIYITPRSDAGTAGGIYLRRQVPEQPTLSGVEGSFTVGTNSETVFELPFNWIIIN